MIYKLQLFSTLILAGLILTVQFIHYPLWRYVSKQNLQAFEKHHQKLISPIVGSLMVCEAITAVLLLINQKGIYVWGFMALLGIWLSTFFLQVPMHKNIACGIKSEKSTEKLIKTNFIRTFLWIFRAVLLTFFT